MRRSILIWALCLGCVIQAMAQLGGVRRERTDKYDTLDTAEYVVYYDLLSRDVEGQVKYDESKGILLIGEKLAKYFNPDVLITDSLYRTGTKTIPGIMTTGLGAYEVFQYPSGKQKVVIYAQWPFNPMIYDDRPAMAWEMTQENKEILGYYCQKATCDFRGRQWEAWFTMQVPLHNGPWKFTGLPGLILEVRDSDEDFVFTATGLHRLQKPLEIIKYDWIYDVVTREESIEFIKRYVGDNDGSFYRAALPDEVELIMIDVTGGKVTSYERQIYVGPELE